MTGALRTSLWPHQTRAHDFALSRRGSLLAVRMGGGKTLATLALLHSWNAQRVLVTTPLSVASTWVREMEKHSSEWWRLATLDHGSVAKRTAQARVALETAQARKERCAIVINHESLWREPFRELALATEWDCLVVDESHRSKRPGGRFSRFLADFCKRQPFMRRLGLTGTPMPHSPLDLYAQARFLDSSIYGTSYQRFKMRYCELGGFENREVVAFKNLDELMERFRRFAFIAQEEDLLDLPGETDVEIPVALEPRAREIYDRLERDFWVEVERGTVTASNALVKLLRLQQLTSGVLKLDEDAGQETISTAKAETLADLLCDIATRDKVVIFGRFVHDLAIVEQVARSLERRYGEVSGRRKDLDQGRFPADVDVLGVQIQAGGLGIDLSAASIGIFLSTGFSLGEYLQARARLHRPGQTRPVTFLHLLATGTVDWRVYGALEKREEVITALLQQGRMAA